jgi:hypothetical protein
MLTDLDKLAAETETDRLSGVYQRIMRTHPPMAAYQDWSAPAF